MPPVPATAQGCPGSVTAALPIRCDSRNIAARFVDHATRFPNAIAIIEGDTRVTYGALLARAQALASRLRVENEPGAVVAIHGRRNINTPLAMIGCLLANITFVVIDAVYVQQRIIDILLLSGARTLLHGRLDVELAGAVAALGVKQHFIPCETATAPTPFSVDAPDTAYLLFTSGTTGFPKGIRTGHAPLIHFVNWYTATFKPAPESRFSMLSGLSHDPLLRDIFVPLSIGAQLHIPRQDDILVPDRLFAWMDASAIEFTHLTPQLIDILHARRQHGRTLDSVKFVFCGGDVLRQETARHVASIAPRASLVNFYGTSETPQAMAYQMIEAEMVAPYPLGRPIADVSVEIVDGHLDAVADGEQGEIAIVTDYLSDGYIVEATTPGAEAQRRAYISRPCGAGEAFQKMYLTGDLGYKDDKGRIFFSGRRDDQVKIRGYRVDCAEVAAVFERHGLAQRAVVLPERTSSGELALLAFVVGDAAYLERQLPTLVPKHMAPAAVITVQAIPLLPNGKTDRAALYELRRQQLTQAPSARTGQGNAFFAAVSDTLNVASIDPNKSLLGLGGDSLSFIRVGLVIEDHLGFLPDGWEAMPLSVLAKLKQDKAASTGKLQLKSIEPAILLRAIAIVLVVMDHAQFGFEGNATSTLLVIAGMSFARFLLPGLLDGGSFFPTGRFILKYGVPAALWQGSRGFVGPHLWLPDVFLLGTLWAGPEAHFTFWFLDILTASILLIAGLAKITGARWGREAPSPVGRNFWFSSAVLTLAIIAFFLQTQLDRWNGMVGVSSVGPFRWLWLVALGMAVQCARYRRERLALTAVLLLLAGLCYGGLVTKGHFQDPFNLFMIGATVLLLWCRRIPIPAFSHGTVLLLAQHSLFIYIFSGAVPYKVMPRLQQMGLQGSVPLRIVLALVIGIVMSMLWTRALALTCAWFRGAQAMRQKEADHAVLPGQQ